MQEANVGETAVEILNWILRKAFTLPVEGCRQSRLEFLGSLARPEPRRHKIYIYVCFTIK